MLVPAGTVQEDVCEGAEQRADDVLDTRKALN